MAVSTRHEFLDVLARSNLLMAEQLRSAEQLAAVGDEPRAIAKRIVEAGWLVAVGPRLEMEAVRTTGVPFRNATLDSTAAWQRFEVIRLDDLCLYLVNGKIACAITGILQNIDRQEQPLSDHAIQFYADGARPHSFRNIEIRAINALPPEVIDLAK